MLGYILLSIFIIIIGTIIFLEIRNERKYQESRAEQRKKSFTKKTDISRTSQDSLATKSPVIETQEKSIAPPKEEPTPKKTVKKLPQGNYARFSHQRLVEMGLSDEEAKEFVQELIPQLETQIPLIEEALNIPDFHQLERLTHSIKGSTTNIGTGGISDLLVDYNTYLKKGTDFDIAQTYFKYLVHYTQELKSQYS